MKKNTAKLTAKGIPPTATERKAIRAMMSQVSIRKAATKAGVPYEMYNNVMSGKSRNMVEFNKIIAAAKQMIAKSERLAL